MVSIHDQEYLAISVLEGRQKCELFLLFNGQGTWCMLEQWLCMVSTWNSDFNLVRGFLYKEKSRGRTLPPFVHPGFSHPLFPELCLLRTPPKPLLFEFVITRKSPSHQGAADALERKCFSHCSHVRGKQGLWGNTGIISPNHFAVCIQFLWALFVALLSQIPATHSESAVNCLYQRRVILFSSPVSDLPGFYINSLFRGQEFSVLISG